MKVLIHYPEPGTDPAGVWWLSRHRSRPESFYLDQSAYPTGARAVLGDRYAGELFTQAQWENQVVRLTESASPFWTFAAEETAGDPRDLVIGRPPTYRAGSL